MIRGFHHTGLVVDDLEAMVEFYKDSFGLRVLLEFDSVAPPDGNHTGIPNSRRRLVFLGLEDQTHQLELVKYLDPPAKSGHLDKIQLGAMHICFNVDDIAATYQNLQPDVRFVTEPKWSRSAAGDKIGVVYGQDPEGNWFELIQWGET